MEIGWRITQLVEGRLRHWREWEVWRELLEVGGGPFMGLVEGDVLWPQLQTIGDLPIP